jgi:hypothetical protein
MKDRTNMPLLRSLTYVQGVLAAIDMALRWSFSRWFMVTMCIGRILKLSMNRIEDEDDAAAGCYPHGANRHGRGPWFMESLERSENVHWDHESKTRLR